MNAADVPDKLRGGNRLQPRWVVGAHMRATLRAEFEARVEAAAAEKAEAEAWADEGSSTARGARKGSSRRGRRNRKCVSDDDNDDSVTECTQSKTAPHRPQDAPRPVPLDTAETQQQCLTAIELDVRDAARQRGYERFVRRYKRIYDATSCNNTETLKKAERQKRQNR